MLDYAQSGVLKEIILHKTLFHKQAILDTDIPLPYGMRLEEMKSEVVNQLVYRMTAEIYGHNIEPVTVSYPATWWQHFKERHFPKFLLKRFPVQMQDVKVGATAFYPNIPTTESPVLRMYVITDE